MELWALAEARQWRRNRDLEVLAVALMWVLNRMPLHEKGVTLDEVLETLPGYRPEGRTGGAGDGQT